MNNQFEPTVDQQTAVADHLTKAVVKDATGEADGDRCVGEPPSARYYLATLAPRDLNLAAGRERRGRETPSSAGFEFEVSDPHGVIEVAAAISCYYRVLPTYGEQLDFAGGSDAPGDRPGRDYRLAPAFQRVDVVTGRIPIRLSPDHHLQHVGIEEFAEGFDGASAAAAADPRVERRDGADRKDRFLPGTSLTSTDVFEAWLATLPGTLVIPNWSAQITVLTRAVASGRVRVALSLENLSNDPVVDRVRRGERVQRHDDARDHFLFRIRLEAAADPGVIVPVHMYLGPDAYRYDPRLPAYANNCGVAAEVDSTGEIISRLWSVPAPEHQTRRLVSKEHPATSFAALAADPIPMLEALARDMHAWMASDAWSSSGLPDDLAAQKEQDRSAFLDEIKRFEDGIRWLTVDRRLLLAFKLANRTMIKLGEMTGNRHAAWRLFQIVFIVSQLAALAWREHPADEFAKGLWGAADDADPTAAATVLFFPTSGGKTEAYLGLIACGMFYDRARGKERGVTAWCRFPLRLLTLQQTQRQVEFIVAADEVRLASAVELAAEGGGLGDIFNLGFFAGGDNTPNSLSRDQAVLDRLIADEQRRKAVRVVDQCPYCQANSVEVAVPSATSLRLIHVCRDCKRELPVHIVDTEVYRYLPALIVGTLDKLANIGLTDRFGALLGDVDCECSLHGLGRGGKCHERHAKGHPTNTVTKLPAPLYDACPTLEIVDELHMVDEELGAFSGHYEGILAVAQRRLSARTRPDGRGVRMKVIATTATIKGEDRQVDHLFGLNSVLLPLPGPSLEESFYWRLVERPMRRFVGIQPNRTTAEQALVRILQALHEEIRRLEVLGPARVAGLAGMAPGDFKSLLDVYRVSLTYVTSLIDFGKLRRSMDTQVNEYLRRHQVEEIKVRELSGDTSFDDVRITLDHLKGAGDTDAVIATSMVSHGVDIDRLNLMVFNGMPKSMAEYIQASSRIGRRYLGVVFMIFNPIRERDRSHFRYHAKFHEYLDRMVEPVAINRWSRYAARKTLPGVLMAEILQVGNREFWDAGRAPAHLHDLVRMKEALRPPDAGGLESVRPEALLAALGEAYLTDRDDAAELRSDLDQRVHSAVTSIRAAGAAASAALGGRPQYRGTGDYLGLEYTPMTSLRDIAEGIPFYVLPREEALMSGFIPGDMARSRGQALYRYRPGQTFDHPGGYVAQVRQYGRDDAYQGLALDPGYLIDEAMNFVSRWRIEGRDTQGAEAGSDRAPEFPADEPLAHQHYEVVIPGKVYCRVWPLMFRCASGGCGAVWEADDPRPGVDQWPPLCPRCGNARGNRQLQYVFVHGCGEIAPMAPPARGCPRGHTAGFRLNDQVSRFQDFRWECLECRLPQPVMAFCPNRTGCSWTEKMMAPQVHTSSSSYSGHGRTLVNVPREEFARQAQTPGFVIGTLGRWLDFCSEEEARSLISGGGAQIPKEVHDSIRVMQASGQPELVEQATALRRRFVQVDLDDLRETVQQALGFDPLGDDLRGRRLAEQVGVFERVLDLPRLTLDRLTRNAVSAGRASRYANYPAALCKGGFDPDRCMLVNEFPVAYLAIGYTRGGFGAREADLVSYKGRASRGQAITNLLYASPTTTEALVFGLDRQRVERWLVANQAATAEELDSAGGAHRWFAAHLDPADGQLPRWDPDQEPVNGDPQYGPRALFRLLHSMAHQVLRALAVDSGYSETGLSEYLFPYELCFAIHPNGGSEFTIGGFRTVLEQNLDEVVARAVGNATCIYDPNCMVANRGADHGCLLLPETACQSWNRFISRWDLFGSPEGDVVGYWSPDLDRA